MNRRHLFRISLAGSFVGLSPRSGGGGEEDADSFPGVLDSNVSLFRWPFRRLPLDETGRLVEKLRSLGITRAWAGSFEGVFHRDLSSVNARLAEACTAHPELVAFGSVNPALPGWERDLEECAALWKMPGIRLHPNYHGYGLDDPRLRRLLEAAVAAGLLVQVAVAMEDTRTHPDLVSVPDVDLAPLPIALEQVPGARVQLVNWRPRGTVLEHLAATPGLCFDTARVEGTDGVAALLAATGPDRVLFGSHAPFLIPEAALIRVHESALEPVSLKGVLREAAARLLDPTLP